jgi:hypothetical protein
VKPGRQQHFQHHLQAQATKTFVQSYDSMMTKIVAPSHDSRFLQLSWLSYLKVGLCRQSDENPKVGTSKKGSASTEHIG